MERKLFAWFTKQRDRHVPVSEEHLREKAGYFFRNTYGPDKSFSASRGWFSKFKTRFGVRSLKICGEKLSSQPELVQPFKQKLEKEIEQRNLEMVQIYNADESALFWKMLPDKTLVHSKEKQAPGRKMCKERITFLCCSNFSGEHKLKIVLVGKSKNPRSFKNSWPSVEYYSTKNAWMTSYIFRQWFFDSFVPQVESYQAQNNLPFQSMLLVDNARCHCSEELATEDGRHKILFLPPNCTSLIQPMDQNAIRITKLIYKKSLISKIVASAEEDLYKALKSVTLRDCCDMLYDSWNKVDQDVIRKCWNRLFPERWDSDDNIPLSEWIQKEQSRDIGYNDNMAIIQVALNQATAANLERNDIINWIDESDSGGFSKSVSSSSTDIENENVISTPLENHKDAIQHFNLCIKWAEENDMSLEKIAVLKELKNEAFERAFTKTKQTNLLRYFPKTK